MSSSLLTSPTQRRWRHYYNDPPPLPSTLIVPPMLELERSRYNNINSTISRGRGGGGLNAMASWLRRCQWRDLRNDDKLMTSMQQQQWRWTCGNKKYNNQPIQQPWWSNPSDDNDVKQGLLLERRRWWQTHYHLALVVFISIITIEQ